MNAALLSSQNMNWCTPQQQSVPQSAQFFSRPKRTGWRNLGIVGGAVFCNPPYGREIRKWVQKAYAEAQRGQTIVLLIPARTDTAFFHDYIYGKAEIRFVRGRLTFTGEDGNPQRDKSGRAMPAPFPSMVVIYNRRS